MTPARTADLAVAQFGEGRAPIDWFAGVVLGLIDRLQLVDRQAVALHRRGIRDLTVERLPGASHLVPVEAPARFGTIVEAFLERLNGGSG